MKNKKSLLVVMLACMAALLIACGSESAEAPGNTPIDEVDNSDSEPSDEADDSDSEPSDETDSSDSESEETPDNAPAAEVDYGNGSMTDWMYETESGDELTDLLATIDRTPYGSAGSSLQQINSGVSLMKLAMDESGNVEEIAKTYLDGMDDTQRDFFSFQWEQAKKTAESLLDGSLDAVVLEDAGDADFDLKAVDSEKVQTLVETVENLLRDAGVTDEWKNHTDLEPFILAGI